MSKKRYVALTICQTISCTTPGFRIQRHSSSGEAMADEERLKKLEAGKAKLAQFRQRKAQSDGQNVSKKQKKKKKASNTKDEESMQDSPDIDQSRGDETSTYSSRRGAAAAADFNIIRTLQSGEIVKDNQTYNIEPESEISTTVEDYSSEVNGCSFVTRTSIPADLIREEEFGVGDIYSEHGMRHTETRLEMMENELAGKLQEIEELNKELEEMRAACGTEGLQQLQEFEAAIKKRDDIITQLTTNLQQARKEKDETMREFLELTEQSQKLQIQFQHLQASETLRNTSHSCTAADLLQAKQQILTHQQQLEEQEYLLKNYQKKNEESEAHITLLQDRIAIYEMEKNKSGEYSNKKLQEKETLIEGLEAKISEGERNAVHLFEKLSNANKLIEELKEQIIQKNQEVNNVRLELSNCKQKERQCSDEIKQLMGTVEELQKRCHKDSQFETDIVQRMELETQRRLAQLQAELDEMHGQQLVQMKQELIKQHALEIDELLSQQKAEMEKTLNLCSSDNIREDEIYLMNITINDLNVKLQDANHQREKVKQDLSQQLEAISAEKSLQQTQIEDLFQELSFAREQTQRAKQTIMSMECRLNEADKYQVVIEDLKAQLGSEIEFRKELELKHEAEVTNYKIKLEMLEREKDAVLDRMAESQEAELERLRTQLLFSHEEELSKLKEDLQEEHRVNIENLKDGLTAHYKQQLDGVQNEMSQKIEAMQFEKDNLITKQNQLILEISKLKDLQQSLVNSKSQEMTLQIQELQKEIEVLRQEKKEKGTLEQEVQELQLKTELLEKQMREREDCLQEKYAELETQNSHLKDENRVLEDKLKHTSLSSEENSVFKDHVSCKSENLDLEKRIEKLIAENEQLTKQGIELKEEIERQKTTFLFAEEKFEVNYQELQKEYACLLKVKADIEDSKNKQEVEYKSKLKALTEELQNIRSNKLVILKTKSSVSEGTRDNKLCKAETFEVGEVIEKDTTELMEKLEVTQREKLELSLRLSDLSEQLKSKHSEICQLSEEVKSLKQEKEQVLSRCKELEIIIINNQTDINIIEHKIKHSKEKAQSNATLTTETTTLISDPSNEFAEEIKVREGSVNLGKEPSYCVTTEESIQQILNPEQQSLLDHLHQMTDRLAGETSLMSITQNENNQLQQQLDTLKSEQTDLQLQMEAQRICLSLVYSAHVDQVREYLQAEKESALCSLKEELVYNHAQEMNELKKAHQLELQTLKDQQTDEEIRSAAMLTEKFSKAISEECSRLTQSLCSVQSEQYSTTVEVSDGEQEISHAAFTEREKSNLELPIQRVQAQALQENMQILLNKIREECNRMMALHTQFMSDCKKVRENQVSYAEFEPRKDDDEICSLQLKIECLQTPSQDLDVMVRESHWEEMEDHKRQLEKQHAQELEHLRSYFQQQLKETEERYTTEIIHLQNRLQNNSGSSEHFSIPGDSQVNIKEVMPKMKHAENVFQQSTNEAVEFPSEIEVKNEMNIIQLLEKQYQEQLEQEMAKVIVQMSVAFAQQTELARMARQKEVSLSVVQTEIVHQQERHFEIIQKCSEEELDTLLSKEKKKDIKHEELKPLSKELSEESSDIPSLGEQFESTAGPLYMLGPSKQEMKLSVESSSRRTEFELKEILQNNSMMASSTETSSQLLLYEERLEDMRQELVRQYQEHQQATETLRQGHMQQMEREKENQEQLLAEIERLKMQLAESDSLENDSLVTERERMLLEELESLKKHSVPGRERLYCELRNSSTQTQSEKENQTESKEPILEDEEGRENPEETSSAVLSKERHALQNANNRLLRILLEVVKTTVAVEETIGHHVLGLLDRAGKGQPSSKIVAWESKTEESIKSSVCVGYEKEEPSSSYHTSHLGGDDISIWSAAPDEGLELTQHLKESIFAGVEMDPEKEELILNISSRLQAAVEKLLEAISDTSSQLEHAKITQTELMQESFKRQQEATEFLKCQEELQERLSEETKAREQLALELSKAEGLIDGYADEKAFLEKHIQEKIDVIDHLEQELLCTGNKLQELEAERQQIQEEKELLCRQKDAMKAGARSAEQRLVDAAVDAAPQAELLEETEKLMKEKIEVQRQAEKEYGDLQKQVKALETDLEEQVNRFIELEQEKNAELMDLRQQNQALEKQLEKTRKFLDEQAIDREHERDVFQQEIEKLEQQLKIPQRFQPISEHQTREVEQLTNHLKEKTDKCSELLLSKEQLQRDIQEQNEEIEKLECRIRELEQALIISADKLQKVEERKQFGAAKVKGELPLEVQLQAEQEAVDRKEKEITNLEEQLEQFREELENKNEEVQQLHMQLEIQRKESTTRLQELEQENKLFKDEMERLGLAIQKSENTSIKDHHLGAGKLVQFVQEKEQKIDHLNEHISELQEQLENTTDNKVIEEKNEHIRELEAQIEYLKSDQERIKKNSEDEIEQLNEVIEKLQQELANIERKVVSEYTYGQEGSVFIDGLELEKIKAESAAAKEELSSCREKVEKLQEELVVREENVAHLQEELHQVKDNLVQTEKKLANYVRKEKEIGGLASRKEVDKTDSVSTKKPTQIRKSSSRTDKTRQINSWSQTSQVLVKDAEIQIDLPSGCSSEEVAEIIREFTEKIDQMQELHAAEIMDMETRHISEAEALKREQFVAVQVLMDECNALKEVIETLRVKEEGGSIPGLVHSASYQARDGCSSDSSSDWGQGIYAAPSQGSDTISEGMGDEGEASTDLLPKKIKGLLRAVHHEGVQVLSLSEFPYSERETSSLKQGPELWLEERKTFLSTISSLKDLITKMQLHREAEVYASCESSENVPDWRNELLHAVQQVFIREQDILLAAFQTELAELGARDAVVLMGQLDHRLQEQGIEQRAAMDCLQNADRRSLLMEIQVLHSQMNSRKTNVKREQEIDPKSQEMLEYNMQQKQSQILEIQVELRSVKEKAAELQEQLNSERMTVAELKNELAQAKLELETTLKAQHKHFKDLETIRTEVKEKATELDVLKDTMANEQKKSRELQWALEKEKAKMERNEERGREELEDLKFSLEDQKQKNVELNRLLEQEKQLSSDLQQKIESQEALNVAQLSHEQGRNCELQVLLETEKARVLEMSSALEKEKELCAQLQSAEAKVQEGIPNPSDELFKELQRQIDEKHDRVVELVSEMEKYKLESVQVRQQMEKEKQIQKKALQTEQDANILAQKKVHELESKVEDLQWQLGEKRQQIHKLQHETKKLQEIIQELQKTEQDREEKEIAKGTDQSLNETTCDMSNERTRNWILQQKMEGAEANEPTYPTLMETKGEGDLAVGSNVLDNIRQKLQNMSSKLKQLAHKAARRLQFETADNEDFIGVQNTIEDVLLQLQSLPGLPQLHELKLLLPPGASSRSFTEGLLRQNAELTGFVSRLSEEKNNLRNAVMKLEEKVRQHQQRGPCGDYSSRCVLDNGTNIDTLTASEREIWNREKLSLQKSLKQADAELSKLRAELRNEAFLRELGSESENAVLKRIYGKYLRAESFRKALIYQKKYLLLLLGGFQECEEATLALIARMGGQPSYTDVEVITRHSKGFTRFRSAVRVSIAISRMKFLVHRWHRVTGFNFISISRDGFSQNAGNEQRSDSFSGGLDLYGEQRHSSLRSRSDLESPRSPVNSQQRYYGFHADINPVSLACPQLQNYDPDRALTDYINRLEALQRRLGSVQSGSASYTQLHCGMRR
ncbi:A-kinase anchor protein 9 isoform X7 [Alligator mississippiensis]|uniref:A-kinase anchor protein 9 isoform X7 n=1 Tax=Alligator mississippiensis TaxID=8496 RepID=UPI00287789B2|nr:A-kinase anchor protein 9 isoform X7 [Alligator mississippiensis]